jgi:hypothetical protein
MSDLQLSLPVRRGFRFEFFQAGFDSGNVASVSLVSLEHLPEKAPGHPLSAESVQQLSVCRAVSWKAENG